MFYMCSFLRSAIQHVHFQVEDSSLQRVEDIEAEGVAEALQGDEAAEELEGGEEEEALEEGGRSWLSLTGMKVCITPVKLWVNWVLEAC